MVRAVTQEKLAYALSDGKPKSSKELMVKLKLNSDIVESALWRMWYSFRVLRSAKPIVCYDKSFRGRAGMVSNVRQYYTCLLCSEGMSSVFLGGQEYVAYSEKYADRRGGVGEVSKAHCVREFLYQNRGGAHFFKSIVEALKDKGIVAVDVMSTVRRLEAKGRVYVRGYRVHDKQTHFSEGYLLTWIDEGKPRGVALADAVWRISIALEDNVSANSVIERIYMVHDVIFETILLRDLVSAEFLYSSLVCSEYEAEGAFVRALKLYNDLCEIKLFGAYRYYYHEPMFQADLRACLISP